MSHEWDAAAAEWYAEKYGEYATNRLAVEALDGLTPTRVLDIGCGTGVALRHASNRWPDATFVGVDPVPRMLEIAAERREGHAHQDAITFKVGKAEGLPVEDAAFDLVFAFDSIDHWADVAAGMAEVARVIQPSGTFVVVKDGGVPGHGDDIATAAGAHFALKRTEALSEGDVTGALWVFTPSAQK